ncbi:matrix metalloproteinase-23 isoform X2 [Stegostoma tigrinum]|uniref:matrix metalloproteinase-23 isoform X2 n=1 Tax=Stegostoma tigrinum TaxID=3053191 RepID=UPI00202B1C9A|nr:matrix metalloproteinase-23 isoform X2 [Stegostoma tigrinum]
MMEFFRRSEDEDNLTNIKFLICIAVSLMFIVGDQSVDTFPAWRPQLENTVPSSLLVFDVHSTFQPQARKKRYTLTPQMQKWDHFNLTYKILSFPKTLNEKDTEKAIALAFQMWSEVSPFNFTEVPANVSADIKIGFYSINHTDCLEVPSHPCFDGITGELAHAFFPTHGEIHFDDFEHWILGKTRFSWKKIVWLTDLVHIAAHEIGHSLGLMHSQNMNALMHKNATLTGKDKISQDDIWGIWRLYDPPIPTNAPTPVPPRTKVRRVSKGRKVTVQCGRKVAHKKGMLQWYKDDELLEFSYPGYIAMNRNKLTIVANAINQGTYTCLVKKKDKILTKYSWRLIVKE